MFQCCVFYRFTTVRLLSFIHGFYYATVVAALKGAHDVSISFTEGPPRRWLTGEWCVVTRSHVSPHKRSLNTGRLLNLLYCTKFCTPRYLSLTFETINRSNLLIIRWLD